MQNDSSDKVQHMIAPIQDAASALLECVGLPPGMVDAVVDADAQGPYIRLVVAPELIGRLAPLPRFFKGYRIAVESRRAAAVAEDARRAPLRAAWRLLYRAGTRRSHPSTSES